MRSPLHRSLPVAVTLLALPLAACAGANQAAMLDEAGPFVAAGPRCDGAACRCRGDGEEPATTAPAGAEGEVPAGMKRFEVRLGRGVDPTWVAVERRGRLVKSTTEAAGACGYLDLPPGRHRVRLHVEAARPEEGIHPVLLIDEWGADAKSWYQTLDLRCGQNDACTKDEVRRLVDEIPTEGRGHGVLDPCGSVRVEGLRWKAERSPDARLSDLDVELVLHIYQFTPRYPHGDPRCKAPRRSLPSKVPSSDE